MTNPPSWTAHATIGPHGIETEPQDPTMTSPTPDPRIDHIQAALRAIGDLLVKTNDAIQHVAERVDDQARPRRFGGSLAFDFQRAMNETEVRPSMGLPPRRPHCDSTTPLLTFPQRQWAEAISAATTALMQRRRFFPDGVTVHHDHPLATLRSRKVGALPILVGFGADLGRDVALLTRDGHTVRRVSLDAPAYGLHDGQDEPADLSPLFVPCTVAPEGERGVTFGSKLDRGGHLRMHARGYDGQQAILYADRDDAVRMRDHLNSVLGDA